MSDRIKHLFFLIILATSAGLSFFELSEMALWHDEAFSMLLPKYGFSEMIHRISLDVHPPLYYIFLKGWFLLFGDSLLALRGFSILFGLLSVVGVYLLVKETFGNEKIALFCSALFGLNSFQIQYAREGRMYSLGVFLVVFSTYLLLRALKSKNPLLWLLYSFSVSCGIYTHYYVLFSILGQGFFFLYFIFKNLPRRLGRTLYVCLRQAISKETKLDFSKWFKNKNFKLGSGAFGLIILSYLPWLSSLLEQINRVQRTYWIPGMNIYSIPATFFKMITGAGINAPKFWHFLIFLTGLILVAIIYFLKKYKSPEKWLIFSLLVVPFLGSIAVSFKRSIYLDRYFIFVLPFYLILIGGAIWAIKNKVIRNILISFLILGSLISFPVWWKHLKVQKKPGMAAIASYLNSRVKPKEKIYVGSSFVYFTFKYYNRTGVHPLLYAPGPLAHFSGTALLSSQDIIKDFQKQTEKGDLIWMLNTTGFGNYQPKVPDNWIKQKEKGIQDAGNRGWIVITKYLVQ